MKFYSPHTLLSIAAIMTLSSCGGGGGTTTTDTDTNSTDTTTTQSITGKAIDGFLIGATVCLDLNLDNYCNIEVPNELLATTNENGSFILQLTPEHQQHPNFKIAPLLVYGGYDADVGEGTPFEGKLKAMRDGNNTHNITPTTTAVEAMAREHNLTKEEATRHIREMLGLDDNVDLGADPIELAKLGENKLLDANLRLQKNMELLANQLKELSSEANSTNDLIANLYDKLAHNYPQDANATDFEQLLNHIIDGHNDFNATIKEDLKNKTKTLNSKISEFIGDQPIENTEQLGTQIHNLKKFVIAGEVVVDGDTGEIILKDEHGNVIDDEYFNNFALMHAKEILEIVGYDGEDLDAKAQIIAQILIEAGMKDRFLPMVEEIKALQANPDTQEIAKLFEQATQANDTPPSEALMQLLAGKTFWQYHKDILYNGMEITELSEIHFTPELNEIITIATTNAHSYKEMIQIKASGDALYIHGIPMVVQNLATAMKDGVVILMMKDEMGTEQLEKLYFSKEEAMKNMTTRVVEEMPLPTEPPLLPKEEDNVTLPTDGEMLPPPPEEDNGNDLPPPAPKGDEPLPPQHDDGGGDNLPPPPEEGEEPPMPDDGGDLPPPPDGEQPLP